MNPILAWSLALIGNFLLSLGMALQKRHVGWIRRGKAVSNVPVSAIERGNDRSFWILGFVLMNVQPIFNYLALLGLPPNVVGAVSGTNVAFSAVLARLMLGERLGLRRGLCAAGIFVAAAVAGLRGGPSLGAYALGVMLAAAVPLAAGSVAYRLRNRGPGGGAAVALAATAGSLGGSMVLSMGALQMEGSSPLLWPASPYLYAYLVAGAGAFALLQVAYKRGELATVSPVFYGMQVLWPSLASYAAFGSRFDAVQAGAFAAIGAAILVISRGSGKEGPRPEPR